MINKNWLIKTRLRRTADLFNWMKTTLTRGRVCRVAAGLLLLAVITLGGRSVNAWGPNRAIFTMTKPASFITFNSITDDPSWGDERGFTLIKDVTGHDNNGATASAGDFKEVADATDGHIYMIKMFVHNNASANLNLIANNTRLMAYLPTASGNSTMLQGMIAADNCGSNASSATGKSCAFWDEAYLKSVDSSKNFKVAYVAGSGRYYNNVRDFTTNGFTLTDDILTTKGSKIGYDQMDGRVQGCFQYSGYATFLVKVTADTASFNLTKQVRVNGGDWQYNVTAKPGDTVEFRINYDNVGEVTQNKVVLKDTLAKNTDVIVGGSSNDGVQGLDYVDGSTYLINASNPSPGLHQDNDTWTTKGLQIGSYTANSNAIVTYKTKVPDAAKLQCGENNFENTVIGTTQEAGSKLATSKVTVTKDCPPDNPTPDEPSAPVPGAPAAGWYVKTAVASLALFMVCAAVLVWTLIKRKFNRH